MSGLRRIAFALFVAVWLAGLAFGAVYALTGQVMPYHLQIMGYDSQAAVPPGVARLYFALMGGVGTLALLLGVLAGYVLFGPLRAGSTAAALALGGIYGALAGGTALIAFTLAQTTGAATPWPLAAGLFGAVLFALVLWLLGRRA